MLQLFPDCGEIAANAAYDDFGFGDLAPGRRPYVVVNVIATADGQARVGADTSMLGNAADQTLLAKLREQVDCVMAGTATIAAEHYAGPASRSETREARRRRGLRPRPLLATVTRGGELPLDAPLFHDEGLEVVVFSEAELALGDACASITRVPRGEPAEMLAELRERFGVRSMVLEGGPHLNALFFGAGLVDELFLTVAPLLTGSEKPFPIIAGALPRDLQLALAGVLHDENHLFLRYRVAGAP